MNEIEYVFGTGDAVVHHWSSHDELADTSAVAALWIDYDSGIDNDAFLPDIPLATVDHRTVLAQEPAGTLSSPFDGVLLSACSAIPAVLLGPPWLDGN
ncbi:hypothetical protein ACTWPB_29405 [Nocardia sp. IBHARD005]|uniref:hypothetical protein n=1 Tax=Nocardia sp. IBHARD005 TaxID=3457765 RepID=UPI00405A0DC6